MISDSINQINYSSQILNQFNDSSISVNKTSNTDNQTQGFYKQDNLNLNLPPIAKEQFQEETKDLKNYYPMGAAKAQLNSTFIVSETKEGIVLVDQHAAHERIVFEKMKKNLSDGDIPAQILLIPEVVNLNSLEYSCLLENKKTLDNLSFKIEPFG